MEKYIITFGSGQLTEFDVQAITVALVVEGEDEMNARTKAFNFKGIGSKFCTSYPYEDYIEEFTLRGLKEYTLEDLDKLRRIVA